MRKLGATQSSEWFWTHQKLSFAFIPNSCTCNLVPHWHSVAPADYETIVVYLAKRESEQHHLWSFPPLRSSSKFCNVSSCLDSHSRTAFSGYLATSSCIQLLFTYFKINFKTLSIEISIEWLSPSHLTSMQTKCLSLAFEATAPLKHLSLARQWILLSYKKI